MTKITIIADSIIIINPIKCRFSSTKLQNVL